MVECNVSGALVCTCFTSAGAHHVCVLLQQPPVVRGKSMVIEANSDGDDDGDDGDEQREEERIIPFRKAPAPPAVVRQKSVCASVCVCECVCECVCVCVCVCVFKVLDEAGACNTFHFKHASFFCCTVGCFQASDTAAARAAPPSPSTKRASVHGGFHLQLEAALSQQGKVGVLPFDGRPGWS